MAGFKYVASQEFSRSHGLLSFCFFPPQMLVEPFMRRHTSRREWCSSSGVKVSSPSWPPSSRSPPRQESSSPSMNQNTGNPSVILSVFHSLLLLLPLPPRFSECSGLKWNPEMNLRITHGCLQMAVDVVYQGLLRDYSIGCASQMVMGRRAGGRNNASISSCVLWPER